MVPLCVEYIDYLGNNTLEDLPKSGVNVEIRLRHFKMFWKQLVHQRACAVVQPRQMLHRSTQILVAVKTIHIAAFNVDTSHHQTLYLPRNYFQTPRNRENVHEEVDFGVLGQVVGLTLGVELRFLGRYWMPVSGHPFPSPTGFAGMKRPSATEPFTLKV